MFNGDLMQRRRQAEPGSFLHRIASDHGSVPRDKIQHLFLAAWLAARRHAKSRPCSSCWPTTSRIKSKALQDIWWALLNSNEFILNH